MNDEEKALERIENVDDYEKEYIAEELKNKMFEDLIDNSISNTSGTVNVSAEEIFVHLVKEQEAIENLDDISAEVKLALEEKLENNLLDDNLDDEIIEAVQGNDTIDNIGELQDVVEDYR